MKKFLVMTDMLDYKLSPKGEKYFKKLKDKGLKNKYYNAILAIRTNPSIGNLKKVILATFIVMTYFTTELIMK